MYTYTYVDTYIHCLLPSLGTPQSSTFQYQVMCIDIIITMCIITITTITITIIAIAITVAPGRAAGRRGPCHDR